MTHSTRPGRVLAWCPVVLGILCFVVGPVSAASLQGSLRSVKKQRAVADEHDYTVLHSPEQVKRFVRAGYLVRVQGNADYELAGVSYPYCRPEVKLFIERLAAQYRGATGEKLVVTSLTRPTSEQPGNASRYSVHPCGMAVDFRRPWGSKARRWLEGTLMTLEQRGVVEATRERKPPHYHVAVFPKDYADYVEAKATGEIPDTYVVRPGDSLWDIARSLGTSVDQLRQVNAMGTSKIYPGQELKVPDAR